MVDPYQRSARRARRAGAHRPASPDHVWFVGVVGSGRAVPQPRRVDMLAATAPGKAILFGEHAVVYGRPALAVPVTEVQATATLTPAAEGFWIDAPDLGRRYEMESAPADDPLAAAVALVAHRAGGQPLPSAVLRVTSTIPIAAG